MSPEWHATYRLQLHAGFPFGAAAKVLPYLARLGISQVYLSPCLQAAPGSLHGYDVTDPTRLNEELGGAGGWRELCHAARELKLGILLDIVPNHMAVTAHNPWWDDLLAHGLMSRYARFFDVVPDPGDRHWRVHLATLGPPYREALEHGEFQVVMTDGRPRLHGGGQSWPLDARLTADEIEAANRDPARLHALLATQHYALHYWRREGEVTNYRRFFDVGSLVGLRMDDPEVFDASHARILELVAAGDVAGLRVDHPDGLADPRGYFDRLLAAAPGARIYVEKILENDERLRGDWPVDGTVGYDFLSKVNRLWMDEQRSDALSGIYADFTGHTVNLPRVVREKKTHILADHFPADLARLADQAAALARQAWQTCDLSPAQLRTALGLLTVELPVYRTYRDRRPLDPLDQAVLARTLAAARSQGAGVDARVFDFLEQVFLADQLEGGALALVARWQQLTPAVTAKGVEDTTFYCYDRLVACNEVGAQASLLGISSDKFHEFCHHLAEHWPDTLLATSTHDTKRSEDVRARICVLTEATEAWGAALREWSALNEPAWQGREPDRHLEYLLYQTLVGAWPLPQDRAWAYVLKACREAKINTSWRTPNATYEMAIRRFVEGIYGSAEFLASLERFVRPLILPGRINSLAQTLIKLTAPGVPDFYQGSELWDLSLVDPDNRRAVDFEVRGRILAAGGTAAPPVDGTGRAKLWLIARGLALRRAHRECFARGSTYQPVSAQGSRLGHVLGFLRGGTVLTLVPRFTHTLAGDWRDTSIPLPPGEWRNWLTGAGLRATVTPAELFKDFPVAALVLQS